MKTFAVECSGDIALNCWVDLEEYLTVVLEDPQPMETANTAAPLHGEIYTESSCGIFFFSWYSRIAFSWSRCAGPIQTAVLLKCDMYIHEERVLWNNKYIYSFISDVLSIFNKISSAQPPFLHPNNRISTRFPWTDCADAFLLENSRNSRTCSSPSSSSTAVASNSHLQKGTVNAQLQSKLSQDMDSTTARCLIWWSNSKGSRRGWG